MEHRSLATMKDIFSLNGKVALVTGGSRGIGAMIVQGFLEHGCSRVYITARKAAQCDAAAKELSMYGECISIPGDVSTQEGIASLVAEISKRESKLDILVNNAGITQDARLQKMTIEQFDRVIDVNLRGVFHFTQAVVGTMINQGSGVILNASSVVGIYGNFGQTNYVASKSGVIGFTKTWARELGPKGIRVNAVAPGFIDTPMIKTIPEKVLEGMKNQIPLRRMGDPADIANAYAFLASDDASYINGIVLEVTGGAVV
jgi:3-oxoacyl-[acyl-carrier protein] reductase